MSSEFEFREEYIGPRGDQDDFTLFAYDQGSVVGYAECGGGDELFVEAMDLRPSHRRTGLGRLMLEEAWALHPEAELVSLAWETPERAPLTQNPASLRVLDHRRRVIHEYDIDTERVDLTDPRVRELLYTAVIGQADQGAASLEFAMDGEAVESIRFEDFDLGPGAQEEFYEAFFQALNDLSPPPASGVRERYSLNRHLIATA